MYIQVTFVGCDIVGHSSVKDPIVQLNRIGMLNNIIKRTIELCRPSDIQWLSGGDGGYLLFFQPDWQEPAVRLITALREWSAHDSILLRVVGHRGPICRIEGADGRMDVLGDGINLAGRILQNCFPDGVIVSETFGDDVARAGIAGVELHDCRSIYLRYFGPQKLRLLSVSGEFQSAWGGPFEEDRDVLARASSLSDSRDWDLVYHAKRLMQANTQDPHAIKAIRGLGPQALVYRDGKVSASAPNPLFGELDKQTRLELIRLAQLIERAPNEFICHQGDDGDTMFIVLKGEVGVLLNESRESGQRECPSLPRITIGAGGIVGELAFALKRNRTASLVALSETSLLSFHFDQFMAS
jgi:Cyclic nucleotide-binding domain